MALDNFRKVNITLNKANQHILEPQIAKVGDVNGRELVVQLVDGGVIKDQTGVNLKINWQHANGNQGVESFSALDATQGLFSVYYPENMLYRGIVTANISINESGKITNSLNFQIEVRSDVYDGTAVEVDGVFFSLKDLNEKIESYEDNLDVLASRQNSVESEFEDLTRFMDDIYTLRKSSNLLNTSDKDFKTSAFISPSTGALNESESYDTTGFIAVTHGKKLVKTHITGNARVKGGMRFIASFDADFNIMPSSGSSVETFDFVIPTGVSYARVSYISRSDFTVPMIAELDVNDNSLPPYEAYFPPYYDVTVSTDTTLKLEGEAADSKTVGDALSNIYQNISPHKKPTETTKIANANSNQEVKIANFPEMLKTGQSISYSAKLSGLGTDDKIEIGFINSAYATYQSWLEITSDRVKWLLSGSSAILNNLHNLTIKDYIDVKFKVTTDTGQLEILIVTNGGSYTFKQTSDSTRFNAIGTLTARATIPTSEVVLSGTCTQFKCDTWLIGDSYFGSGSSRIGGKLMEWGYSNNVLIDGLGGLNSTQAYAEFQKLLKYGTPKTVVWYLGMNDNSTTVASHFPLVEELCDQNGIELIFNRIPLVPARLSENNAVNNYVMASGRRYIDSYSAVGANTSGSWYTGHLNFDGVHPDPLGASALTARMISDVPEILA